DVRELQEVERAGLGARDLGRAVRARQGDPAPAAHAAEDATRPRSEMAAGGAAVGLALQHVDVLEVVRREVAGPALNTHPATRGEDSGHRGHLWRVLEVVPVVEFLFHALVRLHESYEDAVRSAFGHVNCSLSSTFLIFPLAVLGSSGTTSRRSGRKRLDRPCSSSHWQSSSSASGWAEGTTTAHARCPRRASGTPITA